MADQTVVQTAHDKYETFDKLQAKLCQLRALLVSIYGGGGESFRGMNDELQDNFIWACADMAEECERLTDALSPAVYGRSHPAPALAT